MEATRKKRVISEEHKAKLAIKMKEAWAKRKAAKAKNGVHVEVSEGVIEKYRKDCREQVAVFVKALESTPPEISRLVEQVMDKQPQVDLLQALKNQIGKSFYDEGFEAGYQKGTKDLNTTIFRMPEYEPKWSNRDFSLLMPIYKELNGATLITCMGLALDFGIHGMRFDCEMGDAMIYHSRNKLAHRFLGTGATWSLWLDSDMVAPIGRGEILRKNCHIPARYPDKNIDMHVAHRLLGHNKTIVGATYFGRNENGAPMFSEGLHNQAANQAAREMTDGIRETEWVGTGCVLIHKQVFLDIQAKFPELAPQKDPGQGYREEWDFFRPGKTDGEDVAFCKRAKEAGHQVWIDTGLQCLHVGYIAYGSHNTTNASQGKSVSGLF